MLSNVVNWWSWLRWIIISTLVVSHSPCWFKMTLTVICFSPSRDEISVWNPEFRRCRRQTLWTVDRYPRENCGSYSLDDNFVRTRSEVSCFQFAQIWGLWAQEMTEKVSIIWIVFIGFCNSFFDGNNYARCRSWNTVLVLCSWTHALRQFCSPFDDQFDPLHRITSQVLCWKSILVLNLGLPHPFRTVLFRQEIRTLLADYESRYTIMVRNQTYEWILTNARISLRGSVATSLGQTRLTGWSSWLKFTKTCADTPAIYARSRRPFGEE